MVRYSSPIKTMCRSPQERQLQHMPKISLCRILRFFPPVLPVCGRMEVNMKITTRKLAISALLLALDVLFVRVLALNTPIMKIGLGFAAIAFCAMAYGPYWAALISALGDIVGGILFPTGPYFPGFTLTAALTGLIFGLCLYKRPNKLSAAILAAALNIVLVSFLANTALISYISGTSYAALLATRSVQLVVMLPVQAIVLGFFTKAKPIQDLVVKARAD